MRNQWYGDHRDLLKWGVLLHLARKYHLELVIQIAYLTLDDPVPTIDGELGETRVAPEILGHFRNIHHIAGLADSTGVRIEVFDHEFKTHSRDQYTAEVVKRIHALDGKPIAVLLDPDTGILENPKSPKHVTPKEVSAIWNALRPKDWLVLYQHASRDRNWREVRCNTFTVACPGAQVIQFRSGNGARDVAFFAAPRNLVGDTSASS
jgi:hypothetical protein